MTDNIRPFNMDADPEGVVERRLVVCPSLSNYDTDELIQTCEKCGEFSLRCCMHDRICHHERLAFVDGSCLSNGQAAATAGMGVVRGIIPELQWSLVIDHSVDPDQSNRTSQRAELLAASAALDTFYLTDGNKKVHGSRHSSQRSVWVIAADSEYVVKGITRRYKNVCLIL
jgi:hypothetical protein